MSCAEFLFHLATHEINVEQQGDLKQDVVEEKSAEDAAQLLPLLDVPQRESLVEDF